ncbi:hypothetical protein BJF89_11120 [Corynebacterium sp. CNJ-954]|nr:hypothetical protein BJF89_11120 [Corynebacterium sp. CNJ-954]
MDTADDLVDPCTYGGGPVAQQHITPQFHRGLGKLEHQCGGRGGRGGSRIALHLGGDEVTTGDVDVVGQSQRDGLAALGTVLVTGRAVDSDDRGRPTVPATDGDLVTDGDRAGGQPSRVATVVRGVVADDDLHGETQSADLAGVDAGRTGVLQDVEDGRPAVPGGVLRRGDDVVPEQRRGRHHVDLRELQVLGEFTDLGSDRAEDSLVEVDGVDLVHGDDDVRGLHHRGDGEVTTGLFDDAVPGVDEHDDQVRGRQAGDGVPGVLDMARAVGEDEGPLVRGEVAVGHVDGDPLLPFGTQPVDQQGEVRVLQAFGGRDPFHGLVLVGEDGLGVVQQASDERGLSVVDGTGGAQP